MPKVPLNDLSSLANETSAIASINSNNSAIEEGFNNTLSRDGTSPNTMEAQLDMNQRRIVNVPTVPLSNTDVASKYYVDYIFGQTADATATNPSDAIIEGDLTVGGDFTLTGNFIGDIAPTGDIFLASGKKIDWASGDVTINHGTNFLAHRGATNGYTFDALVAPETNDAGALGTSSLGWSDLHLASGGVINWNNGTLTMIQSGTGLTINGGSGAAGLSITGPGNCNIELGRIDNVASTPFIDFHSGATSVDYDSRLIASGGGTIAGGTLSFDGAVFQSAANDRASLGQSGTAWSDLFLASGAVINFNASDVLITHSSNTLAFSGASNGYTFDVPIAVASGGSGRGTATAYAVICGGTTSTAAHQSIASVGTSGQVLTSNGAGALPTFQSTAATGYVLPAEQATTSGTSVTFSSIPSGIKIIHMMFSQVSLSGTGDFLVTIGDSGGLEVTGYDSASTGATSTTSYIMRGGSASRIFSGHMTLTHSGGNKWISSHIFADTVGPNLFTGGGTKTLSDTLDRISLSASAGNFDGGSVNIIYQ